MKAQRKGWDEELRKWVEREFILTDVKGTELEVGQSIWYARHEKSAASEIFDAKITKVEGSFISIEYVDDRSWWRHSEVIKARLSAGHVRKNQYRYCQIVVHE